MKYVIEALFCSLYRLYGLYRLYSYCGLCSLPEIAWEFQSLRSLLKNTLRTELSKFSWILTLILEELLRKRPLQAPFSATFLVHLGQLLHPDDIKKDMTLYGKWIYSGSNSDVFLCSFSSDGQVIVEKVVVGASGDNVYHFGCVRCSS